MLVYGKVCDFFTRKLRMTTSGRLGHRMYIANAAYRSRCGNLIILAPPLVIGENELERGLDIMDALLGELDFT